MPTRTTPRLLPVSLLACTLAVSPIAAAPAGAGPGITVQDLGTLGGVSSGATDVNERGQVVGTSLVANGDRHAFLWERGVMRDLGTLDGLDSYAEAVNDRGQVVGGATDGTGVLRPFLWERGVMRELPAPAGAWSSAVLVNQRGQVVIWAALGDQSHHYLWDRGRITELRVPGTDAWISPTDINDKGWVTGSVVLAPDPVGRAVLWRDGEVVLLGSPVPPGDGSYARGAALNEAGQVAATLPAVGDSEVAALWQDGGWTLLGSLGGSSDARDVNEHGTVVGRSFVDGLSHAVLHRDGEVEDLGALDTQWDGSVAHRLNDREQVIGTVWPSRREGLPRDVLWQDGELHVLPPLVTDGVTHALDINERGQVVGHAATGVPGVDHAVLWTTRRGS
ncbi:extracellular repeat protein, HAF family [Cellulomonas flavigena DSM 20109]|uniref:Extracellular repeat protein, HAF family n=1 Tax=Cellulomonas flavigena (strain ATCC 482 / DSM 20109 / BCRC 11376 / JCM 18109 / NBRC 3775 / NCIMB 8073 / NRS 134) TaxID=446466 RepID=D5UFM8_CELFN|nr:HAF repeat-containing protein [Cellulomonas flavigena]ADG72987.1 extracellular repeat protein, HAF family [Cellulomonas flavigena DSM 20109]